MKVQRLLVTLTVLNLALLVFLLAQMRPVEANTDSPILRGRGLQIVDERGKVRASIELLPPNDTVQMPDGRRGYPETVLLRLIDGDGRPSVKLAATGNGAGMSLSSAKGPAYATLGSERGETTLKLLDQSGKQTVLKPQ
jgi:hypothetical protein